MAGLIDDEDVRALRESASLADIVSDRTTLKRAGSRLKGLCPFHDERTPSFTVDDAKGVYHCFGCGQSGDVYTFVQSTQALSFPEAVEWLARRVGFSLRYRELTPGQRKAMGRRTRLAECVGAAAQFYEHNLAGPDGEPARRYLAGRGLGPDEIARFRLGWASDEWDGLVRHLSSRGFDPREVVDAGLARQGRQGPIDVFRGRVLFPILDAGGGDVLSFGGRIVPGLELKTWSGDTPPKYMNTSNTELYNKSRTLYGLSWARSEIARRGSALVVEGYMDVLGLHAVGASNAIATCGTALTGEHLDQLRKLAGRVVLALDADEAGFAAAERARELAESQDLHDVGVLVLPEGEDPADLAAAGREAVDEALGRVQTSVEFQLVHLLRTADVDTPEAAVAAYRRTFELLARIEDRALRFRYVRDVVAPAVGISADRIEQELDASLAAGPSPGPSAPGAAGGRRRRDPQLSLERQVLQAALQVPHLLPDDFAELDEQDLTSEASRQLLRAVRAAPHGDLDAVLAQLPDDDVRARVRALAVADSELEPSPAKVGAVVSELRGRAVQRRISELETRLGLVREQMSAEDRRSVMHELGELHVRWRELVARGRS